ncbi:bZIP transcription factor 17-like [Salvia miltiorrhiza]|uniref:bZIP transcription factor 17-like n=1 Tax=Salvia miltiorrhiza TaxID=226208 RepID=UPI0025AC02BB|nr:bZIP transcription factor 17-like [Salvia miltiorrhiza]
MADATVVSDDLPPVRTTDFDCGLSVPPFDSAFFSQQLMDDDGFIGGDNHEDVVVDDFDLDFSFDDLYIPTADELDDLLPIRISESGFDANLPQFAPNLDQFDAVFKSNCSELRHGSGDCEFPGDHSFDGSGVINSASSGLESDQISGYLNVPSPESDGSNRGASGNCGGGANVSDFPSPESRGSGNCGSNVSEDSNDHARSVSSSPFMNKRSTRADEVDQKIKLVEPPKNKVSSSLLKRKKDCEEMPINTVDSRTNKHRKSKCSSEINANAEVSDDDEKRNARLIRNRESAQLSRQRKKHYVEELEEKVMMMHSTIKDLNSKISYFMAENATLRQQMSGGAVPPPPMAGLPPGMYPHPAMMYPWMPYAPPYMVKPQGSQVPLVPIPRLKPKQTSQAPKSNKNVEGKKNAGPKTKKVAGISFLGLLFFIVLFGVLAPIVNVRYGGVRETLTGGEGYVGGGFYEKYHGRVLMVNGSEADGKYGNNLRCGRDSGGKPNVNGFARLCNESEPLVASLYVPRNDKLVKIDGNLIIHSVLASEKAMSSHKIGGGETGLAVPGALVPSNPVRINGARLPPLPALGSSSVDKDIRQASDGKIQQWFREGLSGPMLSSGMCTEVFQFDVSPASASGAIISATNARNISEERNHNSTHISKGMSRRILRGLPIPLPESSHNISRQHKGRNSQKENLKGTNSSSSMVVSVLVDPREAGEADMDGVMGKKSLPRIFVVVLIDSVKYVTYSCMLPFKGSALHLVAT